jgi:hypothetical protein
MVKQAGKTKKPRPAAPELDIEAGGLKWKKPDGTTEHLPPLVDECIQLYLRGYQRREVQAWCKARYDCSAITIDRAWATAKAEVWQQQEADKAKRIKETSARFDHVYRLSVEAGDRTNARLSAKDKARVLGDDRPDPMGGLMDSGTLDELLKQVQEQEALLAQAIKDAGGMDAVAAPALPGAPK